MARAPIRTKLASMLVELIGPAATMIDVRDGWPSVIDIQLDDGTTVRIAAHISNITDMGRKGAKGIWDRPEEIRFQNPGSGKPVSALPGATTMLIGILPAIDSDPPAIVVPTNNRIQPPARVSVRFPGSLAYGAARSGWSTHTSKDGEVIDGLAAPLLPTLIDARARGVTLAPGAAAVAAQASGVLGSNDPSSKVRARAATTRLVRDATFRKRVLDAHGIECALCGLSVEDLLHAAHLMPANLPGSAEDVSNGIPACLHHHAVFDAHLMHIDPATLEVRFQPGFTKLAKSDPGLDALLGTTRAHLPVPAGITPQDVGTWLEKRYAAYPDEYKWV